VPAGPDAWLILGYAAVAYLATLAVLGYTFGFLAGLGVPKNIDRGPHLAWPLAVLIDAALLLLFAVQHTVMARPAFKRAWTRLVPAPAERATFVLAATASLALLCWQWRPIGGTLWHLTGAGRAVLLAVNLVGWAVAVSSTVMISHADLFGLRQAYLHARGVPYHPPPFTQRGLYGRVRHPLMTGFVIIFWAAPTMTLGHLLLAAGATGYILVGISFEERDLTPQLGAAYRDYLTRVPALIPRWGNLGVTPVASVTPVAPAGAPAHIPPDHPSGDPGQSEPSRPPG
jgi:protein-S-isoprenylcysteine O-methyltransferase Ste14